jgi:hypothetical protein
MSDHNAAREICDEMSVLRGELVTDLAGIVASARPLGEWRYYVRRFPWPCLSAAALAGFLLVPRRLEVITPDPDSLLHLAAEDRVAITTQPEPEATGSRGPIRRLVNGAARFGLTLLAHKAGELLTSFQLPEERRPPAGQRTHRGPALARQEENGTF